MEICHHRTYTTPAHYPLDDVAKPPRTNQANTATGDAGLPYPDRANTATDAAKPPNTDRTMTATDVAKPPNTHHTMTATEHTMKPNTIICFALALCLALPFQAPLATSEPYPVLMAFSETVGTDNPRTVWTFVYENPDTFGTRARGGEAPFSGILEMVITCEAGDITEYTVTVPGASNARLGRNQSSVSWRAYHTGAQLYEQGQWTSPRYSQSVHDSIHLDGSEGLSATPLNADGVSSPYPERIEIDLVFFPYTRKTQTVEFYLLGLKEAHNKCSAETTP